MKKRHFILFILLLTQLSEVYCQEVAFFFIPKVVGSTEEEKRKSDSFNGMFFTNIMNELLSNFPCIAIRDEYSVKNGIAEMHLWSTPDFGSKDVISKISAAANAKNNSDYYVLYSIYPVNEQTAKAEIGVFNKKGNTIVQVSMSCGSRDVFTNSTKGPAAEFINQLKKHEICPYTGPVTLDVEGTRDETTTDNGPAPCGGGSRTTTINTKLNSTSKWELTKSGLESATGTANFNSTENIKIVSDYTCYRCESGTEGAAKITETQDSEAKVEGLSNESVSEGKKVDDARIKLVFLENATYNILFEATSTKGVLKETKETKVEGACEDEGKPKDTKNKKMDVPMKVVFGPYPGKPTDEVLQQKETKDVSQGQEKTTVTIDFTLTRSEK